MKFKAILPVVLLASCAFLAAEGSSMGAKDPSRIKALRGRSSEDRGHKVGDADHSKTPVEERGDDGDRDKTGGDDGDSKDHETAKNMGKDDALKDHQLTKSYQEGYEQKKAEYDRNDKDVEDKGEKLVAAAKDYKDATEKRDDTLERDKAQNEVNRTYET